MAPDSLKGDCGSSSDKISNNEGPLHEWLFLKIDGVPQLIKLGTTTRLQSFEH